MNNVSLSGKLYGLQTKIIGNKNTEIAQFRIGVYNSRAKKTFYFPVTVFGKNEILTKFFSEDGKVIEICGRLEVEEWEKDGNKHSKVVVIALDIEFPPREFVPQENSEQPEVPDKVQKEPVKRAKPVVAAETEPVEMPNPDEVPF